MEMTIQRNDLVQIINHSENSVVGTVLQVDEVKDWGVLGWTHIPYKGDAYFRLDIEDVVKVGHAVLEKYDE